MTNTNDYGIYTPSLTDSNIDVFTAFVDSVAEYKAVPLMWGNGFALGSEEEKIAEFFKKINRQNNLKTFFTKFEWSLSKYGAGVLFFDKENQIRMANPIYPIFAAMDGEITKQIQCIETSKGYMSSGSFNLVRIDTKGVSISKSANIGLNIGYITPTLPEQLINPKLDKYIPTKGLNGIYCQNFERYNPLIFNLNFRTPDHYKLDQNYYRNLRLAFDAIIEDVVISQNKLITFDDNGLDINTEMDKDKRKYLKNMILRSQRSKVLGGKEVGTEFLNASPNSITLWEGFHRLWDWGLEMCGYSSPRSMGRTSTATGERFSKDLDLNRISIKRKLREDQICQLIDRMLIENDLWDGEDYRPYYFKIFEGEISDKEEGLNRTKQLEDFGYISHYEAIQRMFPNLSLEECEEKTKQIIKIQVDLEKEKLDLLEKNNISSSEEFDNGAENLGEGGSLKSQEQSLIKPSTQTQKKQMQNNFESRK